eukprot:87869-Amphidinium_carterae.1
MSYTVDTDPHSIGMDWWGTTYVQIDAASPVGHAAEPRVKAQPGRGDAVVPSGEAYAFVGSGASHVLLPLHELGVQDRAEARDISVNLAVGKRQAKVWRDEIYAEGTKVSRLLPIGRILDKLALTVNENATKLLCMDGQTPCALMEFATKNHMRYVSEKQFR